MNQRPRRMDFITPVLVALLCLFAKYPFSGAEDINNARVNLNTGNRTDFWGAFSPWFFSILRFNHWEIAYVIFFAILVAYTFITIGRIEGISKKSYRVKFCFFTLQFFSIYFLLSLSRDSALLAFAMFAFGAWWQSFEKKRWIRFFWITISIGSLIIGATFRPWLSLSLPFIVLALNQIKQNFSFRLKSLWIYSATGIAIIALPLGIDQSFHRALSLQKSYPEQQVFIMDIASMACLSADSTQTEKSLEALQPISTSKALSKGELCSQYFPQNWASVVFYGAPKGVAPAINMVKVGNIETYKKLRNGWSSLVTHQIPSYIQTKIMLGSQFLLAGESPNFAHKSLRSIVVLPFETAKALRLFSVLPILALLIAWSSMHRNRKESRKFILFVSLFYISFLMISIIAFIGDNQRYILPGSILVYLLIFLKSQRESHA